MITAERSNSVNVTAAALAHQRRERDFRDGQRKYWQGMAAIYCANADELRGYDDAAAQDCREREIENAAMEYIRRGQY